MKNNIEKKELLKNPNMFSPKIRVISIFGKIRCIIWYQIFIFIHTVWKPIPLNSLLIRKNEILQPFFRNNFFKENIKSFADIWWNNGFFSLLAKFYWVNDVVSYDIDTRLDRLYNSNFYKGLWLKIDYNNIFQIDKKYDCVMWISIMHWLIGQMVEKNNSSDVEFILDTIMEKILDTTNTVAIIEFVLSNDDVIEKFWHHNLDLQIDDYLKSSNKFFKKTELLWYSNTTRIIYALWK